MNRVKFLFGMRHACSLLMLLAFAGPGYAEEITPGAASRLPELRAETLAPSLGFAIFLALLASDNDGPSRGQGRPAAEKAI